MDVNNPKIKDLLDNEEDYLKQLAAMPDKVLEKKLRLARIQMQMALEQKKFNEVDVLYLFSNMIIEARMKRMDLELGEEENIETKTRKKKAAFKKSIKSKENETSIDKFEEDDNKNIKPEQLTLF